MSTNRKPLEFKAAKTNLRPRENRQKDFLFFLADGQSIEQACNLVGVTRAAYEKWRDRHKGFKEAVEAARESHRRDIICGFHGADAYARSLLDAIQRDESLPAPLRYRASKTILTRKGKKDWLPDPIPADAEPLVPYDDEQPESESANAATESYRHGQSERPDLQASKTAAEVPPSQPHPFPAASAPSAAGQSLPQNPDIPDNANTAPAAENSIKNQQDRPIQAVPMSTLEFLRNPDIHPLAAAVANPHPEAAQASEPNASAAKSSPGPGRSTFLSQTWLSAYFLQKHESPKAFERLLANHIHAHQPVTPAEELLVFRITQKSWLLRRIETWERVIADSRVTKAREKYPNAAAPACIAMALLERRETNQTRFYERTAKLRKEHEDALDRLESKLFAAQQRREAHSVRDRFRHRPTVDFPAKRGPASTTAWAER